MSAISGSFNSRKPLFGFDVANAKSYNGATTQNLITQNPSASSASGYTNNGGSRSDAGAIVSYDSSKKAVKWEIDTYAAWGAYFQNQTLFNGSLDTAFQYTMSFEWAWDGQYSPNTMQFNIVQGNGVSPALSVNLLSNSTLQKDGWYKFSYTFIPANTGVNAYARVLIGNKTTGSKLRFWWKNLQLEKNAYRTRFIEGTRTNPLTDVINNISLIGNLEKFNDKPYFSNNTPGLTTSTLPNIPANNFSISFVINFPAALSAWGAIFCPASYGRDQFLALYPDNRLAVSHTVTADANVIWYGPTIAPNKYHHITYVRDATTKKFYVNGQLSHSTNDSTVYSQWGGTSAAIGFRGGGYTSYFVGELPVLKIYDQALSANEIYQNFLTARNRFSL